MSHGIRKEDMLDFRFQYLILKVKSTSTLW